MPHVIPAPDPRTLRTELAAIDALDAKVIGGLVTVMIAKHDRVRDQEWLAETFTRLAVAAHGFDEHTPADADVATIEDYAAQRMPDVLRLSFALFVRTAADLQERGQAFDFEEACGVAAAYLGGRGV